MSLRVSPLLIMFAWGLGAASRAGSKHSSAVEDILGLCCHQEPLVCAASHEHLKVLAINSNCPAALRAFTGTGKAEVSSLLFCV